jgi:hypothetical protein
MGAAPCRVEPEVIGRLRPDVSMSRASEWLEAFKRAESPRPDGQFRASGPTLQRLGDYLRGDTRNTLLALFAASWALVLSPASVSSTCCWRAPLSAKPK